MQSGVLAAVRAPAYVQCMGHALRLCRPRLLACCSHSAPQVAGQSLVSVGATLTYGATTSAAGRPVDVAAEVRLQRSYSNVGSLHDLLSTLLPAGAALTHLTLHADTNPSAESLAALRAPALSELQALTLHDCSAARLRPLVECAPHTAQLSFLSSHSYRWYSKVYELPAALVARPLRRLVLQSADLPDLPAGRWLDGARRWL